MLKNFECGNVSVSDFAACKYLVVINVEMYQKLFVSNFENTFQVDLAILWCTCQTTECFMEEHLLGMWLRY